MTTFKVGDRVRVKKNAGQLGMYYGKVGLGETGYVSKKTASLPYNIRVISRSGGSECFKSEQLEPAPIDWGTLTAGDILIDEHGDERVIYARIGDLVAVHDGIDDGMYDFGWFHIEDLRNGREWTIKRAEVEDSTTELSIAELEKKLNMPSGTLRVKKD